MTEEKTYYSLNDGVADKLVEWDRQLAAGEFTDDEFFAVLAKEFNTENRDDLLEMLTTLVALASLGEGTEAEVAAYVRGMDDSIAAG